LIQEHHEPDIGDDLEAVAKHLGMMFYHYFQSLIFE
jgi:hypothetical protein